MADRTVPLLLTDYEAANLKALLAAMLAGVCPVESPLRAAVVAHEAEMFAASLKKRVDTSGRDYTSAGLKRRIRAADDSVPDGVIAAEEGVSTTYVRRIRRG